MTTGPFTETEKVSIWNYCGFPAYGTGATEDPFERTFAGWTADAWRLNNLTDAECALGRVKLANIVVHDNALQAAGGQTLLVDQAAVFKRNPNEIAERRALLNYWRRDLCATLGIGPGPALAGSGGSTVRLVV